MCTEESPEGGGHSQINISDLFVYFLSCGLRSSMGEWRKYHYTCTLIALLGDGDGGQKGCRSHLAPLDEELQEESYIKSKHQAGWL